MGSLLKLSEFSGRGKTFELLSITFEFSLVYPLSQACVEIQTNEANVDCDIRDEKKIVGTPSIPFNLSKGRA